MRIAMAVVGVVLLSAGCGGAPREIHPVGVTDIPADTDWDALRSELLRLEADDQRYEQLVINGDPAIREAGFFERKDRLQVERAARCKEIFRRIGFPAYDTVGEDASHAFWLLVQHADHDPVFQQAVAEAMALDVERGQANGAHLAYLTDRVRVNTSRPQLYGTQVDHDLATARVFPKPLERPGDVDALRAAVGLEPLWVYMNSHCKLYFDMNREIFAREGITEPYEYAAGFNAW